MNEGKDTNRALKLSSAPAVEKLATNDRAGSNVTCSSCRINRAMVMIVCRVAKIGARENDMITIDNSTKVAGEDCGTP